MAQSDHGIVAIGIILGVLASMSGTAGKQCMRYSELQRRKGTTYSIFIGRVALALGLAFSAALGPLIDMGSYAFAPQSIIAPLGALDVVWNTLTAPFTLGETLTLRLSLGCCVIVAGALTSSLVGSHDPGDWDLESIQRILLRPTVVYYLLALCGWLLFNITVLIPRSAEGPDKPWAPGDHIRGLSLGMTAGSIAGNMFCVKAFVEVCQASIRDNDPLYWAHWFPYGLFVGALVFALTNLYFLTKAMREYEALFMGAVFEGSLIISACVSGVVVFSELEVLELWQISLYWAAIVAIIIGIWMVSCGSRKPPQEEKAVDTDLACGSNGASCKEVNVSNFNKFNCADPVDQELEDVSSMGANGLPGMGPDDSELPAAKLALFGTEVGMESAAFPGLSSKVKSREGNCAGCRCPNTRYAGSNVSQVDDETLFSAVVPTITDPPADSARSRDRTSAGIPCADCAACLCGVSLDMINGTKTWDVMSGLLVIARTPQGSPSPNAGSGQL